MTNIFRINATIIAVLLSSSLSLSMEENSRNTSFNAQPASVAEIMNINNHDERLSAMARFVKEKILSLLHATNQEEFKKDLSSFIDKTITQLMESYNETYGTNTTFLHRTTTEGAVSSNLANIAMLRDYASKAGLSLDLQVIEKSNTLLKSSFTFCEPSHAWPVKHAACSPVTGFHGINLKDPGHSSLIKSVLYQNYYNVVEPFITDLVHTTQNISDSLSGVPLHEQKENEHISDYLSYASQSSLLNADQKKHLTMKGTKIIKELLDKNYQEPTHPIIFDDEFIKSKSSYLGKITLQSLTQGAKNYFTGGSDPQHTQQRRAMLEDVICVVWALTNKAFEQGFHIESGSFSIIDPDNVIYNFLKRYALFAANVERIDELSNTMLNPMGSNFAYQRTGYDPIMQAGRSSHYKGTTQIGIDTRFESNNYALGVLPFNMTHLLFGLIPLEEVRTKTFVKFEERNLGDWVSYISHGIHFLGGSGEHSEKNIPRDIVVAFKEIIESLSHLGLLTETNFMDPKVFSIGLKALKLEPEKTKSTNLSIKEMVFFFEWMGKELPLNELIQNQHEVQRLTEKLNAFFALLEEYKYISQNTSIEELKAREGNEVVLDIAKIFGNN